MFKLITRTMLTLLIVLGCAMPVVAQQMPPIPVDPEVRIGKLPNGLTYYIRHNETPKGQADFYIAQKVGSVLEEDNQRGLAHFLEHMCFNGTENFPGNGVIDWLETIGVKFGSNLNAATGFDETIYNISNVPVARQSVQDSCLLILHDWANALTLDPAEIDKERGVIHQEWRMHNSGAMRIYEEKLPVIYPGNRYGERLPIGTMEVVDNFPPQALRDYYEAWYRPDQQGIIVVGDIDVDYIEGKIKEMFSDIEMPANAPERVYFEVEDTPGTIYAIGSDAEMSQGALMLMFKADPIPDEMKTQSMYLMMKYMISMMQTMLNQRLTEIAHTPDATFADADVSYGQFFVAKTKDALTLEVEAKDNDVLPGFETAYRELLRAARGGFTEGEYQRARDEYLSRLEQVYNGREKRQTAAYVNEYVENFTDNEPMPSMEDRYQLMTSIANDMPLEYINSLLPDMVTDDNRVVVGLFPANDTFKVPTQEEIEAIIASVEAEDIEPYMDDVKAEPLIAQLPTPGKIVSVTDVPNWDAKLLTLSNGAKIYVKTTDLKKDEILFAGFAKGGTSVVGDEYANELIVLDDAIDVHGLGEYTNMDLRKYLQGKQANVTFSLGNYTRMFQGNSTVKDLQTLMELLYMYFTDFRIYDDEYNAMVKRSVSQLEHADSEPQMVFIKQLYRNLYKSPANQYASKENYEGANRQFMEDLVKSSTANAADYVFFFVGDVTVDQITPLAEQYIASLPGDAATAKKDYVKNLDREFTTGTYQDVEVMSMQTPQTWCAVMILGNTPYTIENTAIASIAGQILTNRLLKKIREEMGAVYSIGAAAGMQKMGENNTIMQIPFPMKPELKEQVLTEIHNMVFGMAESITDEELNPIKEYMVKNAIQGKERNGTWLGAMLGEQITGVDIEHGMEDVVNAITTADVQAFMKALLDQNNYGVIILDPDKIEVEEGAAE